MATIKENYCSYEVAKLLKEKGFDGECSRFYMPNGHGRWKYEHYHDFDISERIECPTLQMAMKWLREVHCIWISVFYGLGNTKKDKRFVKWEWEVYNIIDDSLLGQTKFKEECCDTYEEATENGIKYCLENLI